MPPRAGAQCQTRVVRCSPRSGGNPVFREGVVHSIRDRSQGGRTVLYKVTPMLTPAEKPAKQARDPNAPKEPRKRRRSAVFDADGHEVLITMMCLKCRAMKPLAMFGLRKMADGAIRNQPWCRTCRSGASTRKKGDVTVETPVLEEAVMREPEGVRASVPDTVSATSVEAVQLPLVAERPEPFEPAATATVDESEGDDAPAADDPHDGALL